MKKISKNTVRDSSLSHSRRAMTIWRAEEDELRNGQSNYKIRDEKSLVCCTRKNEGWTGMRVLSINTSRGRHQGRRAIYVQGTNTFLLPIRRKFKVLEE